MAFFVLDVHSIFLSFYGKLFVTYTAGDADVIPAFSRLYLTKPGRLLSQD